MTQQTLEQSEKPRARAFDHNSDPYFAAGTPKKTHAFFSPYFPMLPAYEPPKGPGPQPRR
jgi:hypothetical protein